jgi:hypothetical protein
MGLQIDSERASGLYYFRVIFRYYLRQTRDVGVDISSAILGLAEALPGGAEIRESPFQELHSMFPIVDSAAYVKSGYLLTQSKDGDSLRCKQKEVNIYCQEEHTQSIFEVLRKTPGIVSIQLIEDHFMNKEAY